MATHHLEKEVRELYDRFCTADHAFMEAWRAFEEAQEARFKLCNELRDDRNVTLAEFAKVFREEAKRAWEEKQLKNLEMGPFQAVVPESVRVDVDKFYQLVARKSAKLAQKAFDDGALEQVIKATDKLKGWAASNGFTKQLEACTSTEGLAIRLTAPHEIPPFGQPYKGPKK